MAKKKQIKKKKFINMEITRVKMNPEQAVLSCCSLAGGRGVVEVATPQIQCWGGDNGDCVVVTGTTYSASS